LDKGIADVSSLVPNDLKRHDDEHVYNIFYKLEEILNDILLIQVHDLKQQLQVLKDHYDQKINQELLNRLKFIEEKEELINP